MTPPRQSHPPMGRRAGAFDVLLAMGAAGLEVSQTFEPERAPPAIAVVLAFVAGAVLVLRRRDPLPTLGVSLAAVLGVAIAGVTPLAAAPLIGLYTVATLCERRGSLAALCLCCVTSACLTAPGGLAGRIDVPGLESSGVLLPF